MVNVRRSQLTSWNVNLHTCRTVSWDILKMAASSGSVCSWGANSYGQLAIGNKEDQLLPQMVKNCPGRIKCILGGGGHTGMMLEDGELLMCGSNNKGQLGLGHRRDLTKLVQIPDLPKIHTVACGWDHTLGVTPMGELFTWGSNMYGQAAHREKIVPKARKVELFMGQQVREVAAGLRHSLAITGDGKVWSWGAGKRGQLGRTPAHGSLAECSDKPELVNMPDGVRCTKVAAGAYHSAALSEDGLLYVWGCNRRGQLAEVPLLGENGEGKDMIPAPKQIEPSIFGDRRVTDIYCGWTHMITLLDDGSVCTWGRNDYGQLGRDSGDHGQATAQVNDDEYREECCWVPMEVTQLKDCKQISCGSEHNLAITPDDRLLAWGWNEHGMCADGTETNVKIPKQVLGLEGGNPLLVGCGAGHCFAVCE